MNDIKPSVPKGQKDLSAEWDLLAEERHRQIVSGEDLSFEYILVPMTFHLLENADAELVIDIGSGTGDITARLSRIAKRVIGIEPSRRSVSVAKTTCVDLPNVQFIEGSLEQIANLLRDEPITAAVACMTLMTAPQLEGFATAVAALLGSGGKFVATIVHPWFWPRYWGYENAYWFDYKKEIFIEAPFVISKRRTQIRTTHIHRPLEQYLRIFAAAGFHLEVLLEPMPPPEIEAFYPHPWQFPRFIGLRWAKNAKG